MGKANASISRKLADFARKSKGADENGRPIANGYQGTSAVVDVDAIEAEEARKAAVKAAAARVP